MAGDWVGRCHREGAWARLFRHYSDPPAEMGLFDFLGGLFGGGSDPDPQSEIAEETDLDTAGDATGDDGDRFPPEKSGDQDRTDDDDTTGVDDGIDAADLDDRTVQLVTGSVTTEEVDVSSVIADLETRAEAFARAWPEYDLDFSRASLDRLDELARAEFDSEVSQNRGNRSVNDESALAVTEYTISTGSYFAEVFRRSTDADWGESDEGDLRLAFPGGLGDTSVDPMEVAERCLRGRDSFAARYDTVVEIMAAMEGVDESESLGAFVQPEPADETDENHKDATGDQPAEEAHDGRTQDDSNAEGGTDEYSRTIREPPAGPAETEPKDNGAAEDSTESEITDEDPTDGGQDTGGGS